ncbi:MAG: hypothetical protein A2033_07610 [Bacteroidetes bacterium GWA2_31_9]|nr:MAG: hypothetical protein A2033_07610 [Bacteroidetes bacterium GWA2_31_9]
MVFLNIYRFGFNGYERVKIALTPNQYEMLLDYLFVGNLVIDGQEINEERIQNYATMLTNILDKAEEFGKKQLFFSTPQIR